MTDFEFFGGIDFSGAKEPLANLWTAVGRERDGKLEIVALCPHPFRADLAHYVAGGWRPAAEAREDARILWGADFPFGLPADTAHTLLGRDAAWAEACAWIADRPADEVRDAAPGHGKALRRTDSDGAMAPLDLRLYKQTVEGVRWLHGMCDEAGASVLPQAPRDGAATTIVEVYPSATAKDLGLRCGRRPSRPGEVRARPKALGSWIRFANPSVQATAVALEDAWDATLACLTAWLVRDDLDQPFRAGGPPRAVVEQEGWIYRPPMALG